MKLIDQNTVIPLGLAIAVIGGGSFWLSAINSKVDAQDRLVVESKVKQDRISDDIAQIKVDVGIIKESLKDRGSR